MKKLLKFLTGRLPLFLFLVVLQLVVLLVVIVNLSYGNGLYLTIMSALGFVVVFYVVSRDDHPAFKIPWIIVIMAVPVVGVPFYIIFGPRSGGRRFARQMAKYQEHYERERSIVLPHPEPHVLEQLETFSPELARQSRYITNISEAQVWEHTSTEFYPLGELAFRSILREIEQAKRFILMESFILEEGEMWDTMLEVLVRKVQEGVVVRLMYDDFGSMPTLPGGYERKLRALGLTVVAFNHVRPHLNSRLNYRDHRKIIVIDGEVGFTGGINFADEYINRKIRFGHWKDTAVMLKGEAVWNLTLMFLQQWMFSTNEDLDLNDFTTRNSYPSDGFIQPFGDSPLDGDNVAENAYIQIINHAKRYVWITTPYLIIDTQMATALVIAAQSGVDVRIITPNFPDKWYVHPVTRSSYLQLLSAGVRIFEYTPGFIHAKMFVADDDVSIVGTTNMDYRSFYLHFECGVAFYGSSVVKAVKADIERTLEVCTEATLAKEETLPFHVRLGRNVLKLFAPLL